VVEGGNWSAEVPVTSVLQEDDLLIPTIAWPFIISGKTATLKNLLLALVHSD
jgi:hypothetical protein